MYAVSEWLQPYSVIDLQWFLGFANFYWRIICLFSTMAALLTNLLKGKPKRIEFTPESKKAFNKLKQAFITAPALK